MTRWRITDGDKEASVNALMQIIRSHEVEPKDIIAAVGKLKELESQNQKDEQNDSQGELAGLFAVAKQLGIAGGVAGAIESRADEDIVEADQ